MLDENALITEGEMKQAGRTSRLGQMVWAFIDDRDGIDAAVRGAREGLIGGVWLLPDDMPDPAQAVLAVNRLQDAADAPLLVGVDAEAGLGAVMGGATRLPAAMAVGATGDVDLARLVGEVTAMEAAACGINAVGAPVLDVNSNPANPIINTRAFGGDPDTVTRMGLAFAQGLGSTTPPVLPIAKHFPGHGDTVQDSHLELGRVLRSRSQLDEVELAPFRAAVNIGIPMLMTAHVAYPTLDPQPNRPATLSPAILIDVLRDQLGFQGAVVTDAMNMHAIAHDHEPGEAAVLAAEAGCDLILIEAWEEAATALAAAVDAGRLSHERVRRSTERIHALKQRIFGRDLVRPAPIDPRTAAASIGSVSHVAVAERIAAQAVTLLDGEIRPPTGRGLIVVTQPPIWRGPPLWEHVGEAVRRVGRAADLMVISADPSDEASRQALRRARDAGWAAILHVNRVQSYHPENLETSGALLRLVRDITQSGTYLAVAAMGSPYALTAVAGAGARLCGYGADAASLLAMLRVLNGASAPHGRLPVALSPGSSPARQPFG